MFGLLSQQSVSKWYNINLCQLYKVTINKKKVFFMLFSTHLFRYSHVLCFFVLYNVIKSPSFCIPVIFIGTLPVGILSKLRSFDTIHVLSIACQGFFYRPAFTGF